VSLFKSFRVDNQLLTCLVVPLTPARITSSDDSDRIHIHISVPNTPSGRDFALQLSPERPAKDEKDHIRDIPVPLHLSPPPVNRGTRPSNTVGESPCIINDVFDSAPAPLVDAIQGIPSANDEINATSRVLDGAQGINHYETSYIPCGNQFVTPPLDGRDWVPAHRRIPGLPSLNPRALERLREHFCVPPETRAHLPRAPNATVGIKEKKWYVVWVGYDNGIFWDYWQALHRLLFCCSNEDDI
jgi:hypothetical protein